MPLGGRLCGTSGRSGVPWVAAAGYAVLWTLFCSLDGVDCAAFEAAGAMERWPVLRMAASVSNDGGPMAQAANWFLRISCLLATIWLLNRGPKSRLVTVIATLMGSSCFVLANRWSTGIVAPSAVWASDECIADIVGAAAHSSGVLLVAGSVTVCWHLVARCHSRNRAASETEIP